jgi:hypothetical protein
MRQAKRLSAEFLIIVVGVLAALGVDSWSADRRDRALGSEYELRLLAELRESRHFVEGVHRSALRAIEYASASASYFETGSPAEGADELIVALYNMGRDNPRRPDRTTYDDVISTGRLNLITPVALREAIQRAYAALSNLESQQAPYRDEYLKGVRGAIPQELILQIREACPNISAAELICQPADLPDEAAERVLTRLMIDEAATAFRIRQQSLPALRAMAEEAMGEIDLALELLTGEAASEAGST